MLRMTLQTNTTLVLDWNTRPFSFFSQGPSLPTSVQLPAAAASPASQPSSETH
jgi:hypothetical protein